MADHLTAEVTTGGTLATVPAATSDEVVGLGGGYAHHIVNAAAAAQRVAYQAGELGQKELGPDRCVELIAETVAGRNELYSSRILTGADDQIGGGRSDRGWTIRSGVDDQTMRAAGIRAEVTETWGLQLPASDTAHVRATVATGTGGGS